MSSGHRHPLLLCGVLLALFYPLPESARAVAMRPVKIGIVALFVPLILLGVWMK